MIFVPIFELLMYFIYFSALMGGGADPPGEQMILYIL